MGDRVQVTLTIPRVLISLARPLFTFNIDDADEDDDDYIFYTFDECNYGDLPFTDALIRHGIPHDRAWEEGSDYGSGTEYYRFTPEGELICTQVFRHSLGINIPKLLELINNYEELKDYILERHKDNETLPWDNQIEYGRIYRARRLITG